jgi:hypothetical protein
MTRDREEESHPRQPHLLQSPVLGLSTAGTVGSEAHAVWPWFIHISDGRMPELS